LIACFRRAFLDNDLNLTLPYPSEPTHTTSYRTLPYIHLPYYLSHPPGDQCLLRGNRSAMKRPIRHCNSIATNNVSNALQHERSDALRYDVNRIGKNSTCGYRRIVCPSGPDQTTLHSDLARIHQSTPNLCGTVPHSTRYIFFMCPTQGPSGPFQGAAGCHQGGSLIQLSMNGSALQLTLSSAMLRVCRRSSRESNLATP